MENKNSKIIASKEKLAAEVLEVAQDALDDIKACMPEAGVRDLLNIFNSAIKTHRDLMSDIVAIQETETKAEQQLAKEYDGKVDELLKRISGKKE
jgi:aminoglycoside/choline kinase family phosphotransferase